MASYEFRKTLGSCVIAFLAVSICGGRAWAAPGDYRERCTPDAEGQQVCRWEVCESVPGLALAARPQGKSGITPIGQEEAPAGGCRWIPSDPPPQEATFCCEGRSTISGVYTNCSKILNYQKAKQQGNLCGQGRNGGKAVEVECTSYAWNTQTGNLHDCR